MRSPCTFQERQAQRREHFHRKFDLPTLWDFCLVEVKFLEVA